jgi:NAD(P)-dependent dehydrogenase (short-subunit alcohol dehydrogenase family)
VSAVEIRGVTKTFCAEHPKPGCDHLAAFDENTRGMSLEADPSDQFAAYRRLFDLRGRTALVTGASRGIGRAVALALAAFGCDVAAHFSAARAAVDEVAAQIRRAGRRATPLSADLTITGEGRRLARAAFAEMGRIDVVVANASIEIEQPFERVGDAEFDRQVNINLRSTMELMQELLPPMAECRWGRFVTIGTIQQISPNPRKAIYAATKSAQANLALSMAKAYAPYGVTVNNVAPGLIATDRTESLEADADLWLQKLGAIPLGRAGTPKDMTGIVVMLCSDAGGYITGQNIFADGGLGFPGMR